MKSKSSIIFVCVMLELLTLSLTQLEYGLAADLPSPSWRTKADMPTARGQASVITGGNGLIYVMGGYAGSNPPNATVEAYNPLTDTWTTKEPMLNATRGAAIARGPGGVIYVIGGVNGTVYFSTVQAYNTTSRTWSLKTAIPTAVWMAAAATSDSGKIHVFGGESPADFYSNETQIYDPSVDSWTKGADVPTGRSMLGVVTGADGLIYAMGGYNGTALSVVEAYDPSNDTWIRKASMPSPRLEFGAVLGPDEKIYVIGGGTSYFDNEEPFFDTVEIYDPKTDSWTVPTWSESTLPTARKELGAALGVNGRIYAVGGTNGTYVGTNEEGLLAFPAENVPPMAYIDSVTPNPATPEEVISFVGFGVDSDGSVTAYKWRSSINGTLSTEANFTSTLSEGIHTIYFSVKDNSEAWSEEVAAIATVNPQSTGNPFNQKLLDLNNTVNVLSEQVANLTAEVDLLAQQNDELTQQNQTLTVGFLGISVATIVVVIVSVVHGKAEKLRRFSAKMRKSLRHRRKRGHGAR